MNTGIYVRVSTEEQSDYEYSIEAQLRELRNYCNQRNLTIIYEYNDAGYSAKDLKRPEMEKMIEDIKKGRINLVVAMKVDRLTREGYDGQWFLKFCKENNCGLILLQENYDVTTPDGEMMYGMSYYSDKKKDEKLVIVQEKQWKKQLNKVNILQKHQWDILKMLIRNWK